MDNDNANIEKISFEEIQEFKNLNLFELTEQSTGNRLAYVAYDADSKTFTRTYSTNEGGSAVIDKGSVYYGGQEDVEAFLNSGGQTPSLLGYKNGDAIISSADFNSITKLDLYEVVIDNQTDAFIYSGNLIKSAFTLQQVTEKGDITTSNVTADVITGDQMISPNIITNDADIFEGSPKITGQVTLTQAEYNGLGTIDNNVVYCIVS